ncbi:hypothetical protein A3860_13985 [Niastella vici]|uniref:Uncharacterized protein n=1 Tax=Niastella vici TaxID=1703345 RepID=A0A1V9G7Y6_9BACT|nr:hypothetical protein A3860_13985 [Niastella vici]
MGIVFEQKGYFKENFTENYKIRRMSKLTEPELVLAQPGHVWEYSFKYNVSGLVDQTFKYSGLPRFNFFSRINADRLSGCSSTYINPFTPFDYRATRQEDLRPLNMRLFSCLIPLFKRNMVLIRI